ncbi:MAG: hypothetical protein K2I22_06480 [Lachnospiraceae bacterium]|nr:hypothetical protein [Lachnospiraceae bacterium]
MTNQLEHRFSIKRISKTTEDDYIKALRIYNDTTPFEIKTPTNEITYWISKQKINTPFEVYAFILYLNDEVIGLSMTTYVKKTKVVVDEYLAVLEQYRIQTIFLVYESLIQNYYTEIGVEISYYLTEISYKESGKEMDRESRISLKMLCIEEYGKIDALYYALPLGLENYESNFIANIYIKGVEPVQSISPKTYQGIIDSIYYDYWYTWYTPILSSAELDIYKRIIDKNFELIKKSINNTMTSMPVLHSSCNYLNIDADISKGAIPVKKSMQHHIFLLIAPIIILLPLVIIWGYSEALKILNLSISALSTMIGTIISAIITSLTTLFIARKKL